MKNKTRKLLYRIVCVLLVVMILWAMPVTAFAETQSIEMENTSEDTVIEQDDVALSSNTGYSYSAPDDGDFLIENVSGTISIADNIPIIQFGDYTVQIPAFDYY